MNIIKKAKFFTALIAASGVSLFEGCSHSEHSTDSSAGSTVSESALARISREGVIRVGYGVWPPYTQLNLNEKDPQKQVSGYSVDLMNEIASRAEPKLKVEFIHFDWATMKPDLDSRRFDIVMEPIFMTVPRAQTFSFSKPWSWFGIACAIVRKDDNRFGKFSDLDRSDITIALAEGWTSTDYAKANLKKPKFKMVVLRENNFAQLEEVLYGRADVALQDSPTVLQFAAAHPKEVKALWLRNPPSVVAGGFVTRQGENDFIGFLNTSLEALQADGTMRLLDAKWHTLGMFEDRHYRPGDGLTEK